MPLEFPDVEVVLVELLETLAGGAEHIDSQTPQSFDGRLPFVRVVHVDGPSDALQAYLNVDIDVFAPTRAVARPLAVAIHDFLTPRRPPSPLLETVRCDEFPRELPWGDRTVRRWGGSYRVVLRRRAAA